MSGRQPTHVIWASIGAAWVHEDGDGMSLKLNLLPVAGQDIVVRKAKPKSPDQVDAVPY
jgi:hypothetical protein